MATELTEELGRAALSAAMLRVIKDDLLDQAHPPAHSPELAESFSLTQMPCRGEQLLQTVLEELA